MKNNDKALDFNIFKSSFDNLDIPTKLTNKLLYLTNYIDLEYLDRKDLIYLKRISDLSKITGKGLLFDDNNDAGIYSKVIYNYFRDITSINRDHLFTDGFLLFFIFISIRTARITHLSIYEVYRRNLESYLKDSINSIYINYQDYLYFASPKIKYKEDDIFSYLSETFNYSSVFNILLDPKEKELLQSFDKKINILIKRIDDYASGLDISTAKLIMGCIGSYCIYNNCHDKFDEYADRCINNIDLILDKLEMNQLDFYSKDDEDCPGFTDTCVSIILESIINESKKVIIK